MKNDMTEVEYLKYLEDPSNLLCSGDTDAQNWAKSWQMACKRNDINPGGIDEDWMISWLSNAMMSMHDAVKRGDFTG